MKLMILLVFALVQLLLAFCSGVFAAENAPTPPLVKGGHSNTALRVTQRTVPAPGVTATQSAIQLMLKVGLAKASCWMARVTTSTVVWLRRTWSDVHRGRLG